MESAKAAVSNVTGAVSNVLGYNNGNQQRDGGEHASDTTSTTSSHHHATTTSTTATNESSQGSRTVDGGARDAATYSAPSKSNSDLGADLEQTLSGPRDPAVQGEDHPKLTGDAAPGSHSAVFGLTPDGTRHDDTTQGQQAPVPKVTE